MKNLAPKILRQRLLIEGFYQKKITREVIEEFFAGITSHLNLRAYGKPIIFSPEGVGKEENQDFDCFIPLIDSGISLYIWSGEKFLSAVIYTCKSFDAIKALEFTQQFFDISDEQIESMSF